MDFEPFKPQIAEIARKHSLDLVVLFGSQATGRTHPRSDVDIAVKGQHKIDLPRFMVEIDKIFGRNDTQAVDLESSSPTLMISVVNEGKALYERYPGAFLLWKAYAMRTWMETAWLRKLSDKKLIEWAKNIR